MAELSVIGLKQNGQLGGCIWRFGLRTRRIIGLVALVVSASTTAALSDEYPSGGIAMLRATCAERKDIPPAAMQAYCDCYVDLIQKTLSWRDFLFLDSAIRAKGLQGLDAEEGALLGQVVPIERLPLGLFVLLKEIGRIGQKIGSLHPGRFLFVHISDGSNQRS